LIPFSSNHLYLSNLSQISNSTFGIGNAGNINILSRDKVTIDNGVINSRVGAGAVGNAGDINIQTRQLTLINGGEIDTLIAESDGVVPAGQGIAGNINIVAKGNYNANNGLVNARSEQAGGGNIEITARNINLRNNSDIRTDLSSGNAKGGNIFLTADTIIALEDSDILAFASEGQGGDITFNTRAVFSDALG
jgi:large exoprotein involved in heme utilization and adhesion